MKRILLCLMMYGSCTHAMLIRMGLKDLAGFRTMGEVSQKWAQLGLLFHRFAFRLEDLLDEEGNPIFPAAIARAEELPQFAILPLQQVDQPDDEDELKEQQCAQKLEARENAKRAWLASRHHDKHLPKKNKWVCQQPRYNKK